MPNYTSIRLQASQNLAADPVAVVIITLTPALCLPIRPGISPPSQTSATISTTADPVPAPHAPTSTDVTSQDAMQATLAMTTPNFPATERTALSRLQALAVPPEAISELSLSPPINIPKLASYLHDHPYAVFPTAFKWVILVPWYHKNSPIYPLVRKTY